MAENIKCADCKYVRADKKASDGNWTAYECGCVGSDYYKALLNVTPNGMKQDRVSWRGCEHGERRWRV